MFYIIQLSSLTLDNENELEELSINDETIKTENKRRFIIPKIYKFNPITYKIEALIDLCDAYYE
jgi:hypothetical protein